MHKKKIVSFSHSANLYGAPRSHFLATDYLSDDFDQLVIFPEEGEILTNYKENKIPFLIIPRKKFFKKSTPYVIRFVVNKFIKIKYFFSVLFLLLRIKPDIVYVNTVSHTLPIVIARLLRINVVVHIRESEDYLKPEAFVDKIRVVFIKKLPSKFIVVSNAIKELLIQIGVPESTITVVYNGVDASHFRQDLAIRETIRNELGFSDKDIVFGNVGQIVPRKGIDTIIEAAGRVKSKHNNYKYLFIGGPTESEFFSEVIAPLVSEYDLNDDVTWIGYTKDVLAYYSAMDVFIMASRLEPFARVNLEAMAMSLPVIATDVGGNPEAIQNGTNGELFEVGNAYQLAEKLDVLSNDTIRKKYQEESRKRVSKLFTLENYYQGVTSCLNDVLS